MAKEITPTEENIRTRAYYLWEADGKPAGRDLDYWTKAQQEMTRQEAPLQAAAAPVANGVKKAANGTATKRRSNARTAAYA